MCPGIIVSKLLSFLILGYRYGVSPHLGMHCRFHPSCSSYALEALERHGTVRAGWLIFKRLVRCHPWHPGGHDPVP